MMTTYQDSANDLMSTAATGAAHLYIIPTPLPLVCPYTSGKNREFAFKNTR